MHCRYGSSSVILRLAAMILINIKAIKFLRVLFVVEDTTPDLFKNIGVAALRKV